MKNFSSTYNRRLGLDPPGIYEYFLDNFWSKAAGFKMIAELLAGEKNEFAEHFIINRNIPYAGPKSLRAFLGILKKWYPVNVAKNGGHL